ncbi:MAG: class I SAM-dependent DNA methyltransferase [Thermoleophilia bacterium]
MAIKRRRAPEAVPRELTPSEFARKWEGNQRTERAAAQEHFIDLCRMLGVATPNEADAIGTEYAFEKGAEKTLGGDGFADVWKRGYFAWEYKGKHKDLKAAYKQLLQYREALDNPPLLIVCDLDRFEIHTNFTNTPANVYAFDLKRLRSDPAQPLRLLRAVMHDPQELRPDTTRDELTAAAAREFASLAERLRARGYEAHEVAHFLDKLLFCMFAEDAGLLPANLLGRLAEGARSDPAVFSGGLHDLFTKMADKGGLFGVDRIDWFNGGLFDSAAVLPLTREEITLIERVSRLDWAQVEPAIFGTLFERGLDPDKRTQLGAHYTDRASIMRLIEPVLLVPLQRDFAATRANIEALLAAGKTVTARTPAAKNPLAVFNAFLDRLRAVRVLDPACGSGNFLYLALLALKDLEREAVLWASLTLNIPLQFPQIGPQAVLGIEVNSYAAELARVVIWIGEIQWMLANGFAYAREPILKPLDTIEQRDALLDFSDPQNPLEAEWPGATVIIGNPPFLGGKLLRANLGDDYVAALFAVYEGRVPREADFVCYWHEKARALVEAGAVARVGLLATQGIRGGANRRILERLKASGDIFLAWADEPWVLDGAAVHISFVGFDDGTEQERYLNGRSVPTINANLTSGIDLTVVKRLSENRGLAFMGDTKGGAFDIAAEVAAHLLAMPNPDGRSNHDVVRPWVNGLDVTRRSRDMWIIDFGTDMPLQQAALYEGPFEYVRENVMATRMTNNRAAYAERWWLHVEPRTEMRRALADLERYIATPTVTKHRLFVWLPQGTLPDHQLIVFARNDDYFFGVLHSRVHEVWARGLGTQLREVESGFRYTPTSTFETFPFPAEPSAEALRAVAEAARELDALRVGWLNPPQVAPGELAKRTLTNLYNARPTWLTQAHERLDNAVHAAYGWPYPLDDDGVLARLLELNLTRSAEADSLL